MRFNRGYKYVHRYGINALIFLFIIGLCNYYIVLTSFVAVATHKYVISFCVGLELYNAGTPRKIFIAYILVYALMSPIGIGVGITITAFVENNTTYYFVTI